MVGRVYVGAHNPLDVVCGAALGIAIGGAVNLVVGRPAAARRAPGRAERDVGWRRPRRWASCAPGPTALVVVAACGVAGCGDGRESASPAVTLADDAITVGSFDFAESVAVAEVYSQGLEAAGYQVERAFSLGPREFVGPAMSAGLVELVPEYAGTALLFHSLGRGSASSDPEETHARLVEALAGDPVRCWERAGPGRQRVRRHRGHGRTARARAGQRPRRRGPRADVRGPARVPDPAALPRGLDDVYGARFREFVALDAGGPLTHQALAGGDVDVALLFTTDPAIESARPRRAGRRRRLQPAENITPIVRAELVRPARAGLVDVIDSISAELTTARVRDLNATSPTGTSPPRGVVGRGRRTVIAFPGGGRSAVSLALARSHRRVGHP